MPRFIFTRHVKLRIWQRSLSQRVIEDTVKHPNKIIRGPSGALMAQKDFGSETLEVVYKKSDGRVLVITAYWLKEV